MERTPEDREFDLVQSWLSDLSKIDEKSGQTEEKFFEMMDPESIVRIEGRYRLEKKKAKEILDSIEKSLDEQRRMLDDIKRRLEQDEHKKK